MYFAAIGLQSRRYSLMVIPFFLLLLLIPEQGYVPYVQNSLLPESFLITMKWIGVTFVVLLLLIDFPLKKRTTKLLRGFESLTGKRILGINFKDLSVIALICLTVGASFYSCLFYAQNAPLDVNENTTIETTGIKQAVMWVDSNIPQNSRIATNNFYEFPFFLSYLSSRNYSLVYLPGAETTNVPVDEELNAFLSLTSNGSVDYLIIFTVLGYMYWYPYLGDYVNNPPPGMYEVNRTSTFVIYKAWSNVGEIGWQGNFSQGWRNGWSKDPRGSYQMSSSGVETVDGSLHMFGLSSNGDKTPWAHWMAISTSVPSINVSSYPYLIVNFRNYNNTELQVDVVINGNLIYSVGVAKPGNMTSVIDLRESVPSGNVTEILLLARTSGENMILNVYVNRILLARSIE
jgi:hypothetical protein